MGGAVRPAWKLDGDYTVFTTVRDGGVSAAPFASLNLAAHVGDNPEAVAVNRRTLSGLVGGCEISWLDQVHGNTVVEPGGPDLPQADGYYLNQQGIACAVLTADCLPVVLASDHGDEIAVLHAGWRGLLSDIIHTGVKRFSAKEQDLQAWLGPAIGPQSFEVGEDVFFEYKTQWSGFANEREINQAFVPLGGGKYLCDLYRLARLRLLAIGITRICGGEHCTFQDRKRFFSYRRDGATGRMATVVRIND